MGKTSTNVKALKTIGIASVKIPEGALECISSLAKPNL
jgi:hypothetical protein